MAKLNGHCDPRFARVHDALAANIAAGKEVGASLYVNIDGEDVVDLWGGWRDKERRAPWTERHNRQRVLRQQDGDQPGRADAGRSRPARPRSRRSRSTGRSSRRTARRRREVRHLLSHTVGLPAWEPPFSLADAHGYRGLDRAAGGPGAVVGAGHARFLPRQHFRPSERRTGAPRHGQDARADSSPSEIAGPLQADFYLGLDRGANVSRVATVYPAEDDAARPQGPDRPAIRG